MGVGIDESETALGRTLDQAFEVSGFVNALERGLGDAVRLALFEVLEEPGFFQMREDSLGPFRSLGMSLVHLVLIIGRVGEESEAHGVPSVQDHWGILK